MEKIKKWNSFNHNGKNYDLSHLDYHIIDFIDEERNKKYKVHVTYSHHCFTKENPELTKEENEILIYYSPKDKRPFNFERYNLSFRIKEILLGLEKCPICFHDAHGKFIKIDFGEEKYILNFSVYREKKKMRLHVLSAYAEDKSRYPEKNIKKMKKINFFIILFNTLNNKKIKPS